MTRPPVPSASWGHPAAVTRPPVSSACGGHPAAVTRPPVSSACGGHPAAVTRPPVSSASCGFKHQIDIYPDLVVIVGLKEMLLELNKVLETKCGKEVCIGYDTTFLLGDFYVSVHHLCLLMKFLLTHLLIQLHF